MTEQHRQDIDNLHRANERAVDALSVATADARDAAAAHAADAAAVAADRAADTAAIVARDAANKAEGFATHIETMFKKYRRQQLGAFLLLVIVCVFVLNSLRVQQDNFQISRVKTFHAACEAINHNAKAIQKQDDFFAKIIIDGAKSSKVFNKVYATAGAPDYPTRLKQAQATANTVIHNSPRSINCATQEKLIRGHP